MNNHIGSTSAIPSLLFLLLQYVSYLQAKGLSSGIERCCDQIFLSSSGPVAKNQLPLLGVYRWNETATNDTSEFVFTKSAFGMTFYFFFMQSVSDGPLGWIASMDMDGNSLNIVTRNTKYRSCPVGIRGAYDQDSEYDSTFRVQCHSEEVNQDCCTHLSVSASNKSGVIYLKQNGFLGNYTLFGDMNGFPMYHKHQWNTNSYLYFKKEGTTINDGWTFGQSMDQTLRSITTRMRTFCPNGITRAYNLDNQLDTSFNIECLESKISLDEDKDENSFEPTNSSLIQHSSSRCQRVHPYLAIILSLITVCFSFNTQ